MCDVTLVYDPIELHNEGREIFRSDVRWVLESVLYGYRLYDGGPEMLWGYYEGGHNWFVSN